MRKPRTPLALIPPTLPADTTGKPAVTATGGGLQGAQRTSRELESWTASRQSPDRLINRVKDEADARGREMVTNDGYAQGVVDIHRDSIVGHQYRLNAQPNYDVLASYGRFDEAWAEEFQLAVEERFALAAESQRAWFDASRVNNFTQIIRLTVAGFVFTGEALATAEWIRESDRPFATAVQMISPSRLCNPMGEADSRTLRRGVVRDRRGKPLGYHIRQSHPGDNYDQDSWTWKYVPASLPWGRRQVIHITDQLEPDQTRGISAMVAVLKDMRMTRNLHDLTLQNAVLNASYAATIESELPNEVIVAAMGGGAQTDDPAAGYTGLLATLLGAMRSYASEANGISVDGVKIPHLFPGTKLNARTLGTPGVVGTEFETALLRHIAAGLGISYEEFARDFSKTNYSSARASMLTTWKHMQARKKFVADRMANEIFALWLEEDLAAGNLPLPRGVDRSVFYQPLAAEALTACDWIGASRGQIDELKETQAALLRVKGGMSTLEIEVAKTGGDYRKVLRQRAREQQLAKKLGVVLDQGAERDGSTSGQTVMQDDDKEAA